MSPSVSSPGPNSRGKPTSLADNLRAAAAWRALDLALADALAEPADDREPEQLASLYPDAPTVEDAEADLLAFGDLLEP